jgi:hypothetical protein
MYYQIYAYQKDGKLNHAGVHFFHHEPTQLDLRDEEILWRLWRAQYTKELRTKKENPCPIMEGHKSIQIIAKQTDNIFLFGERITA